MISTSSSKASDQTPSSFSENNASLISMTATPDGLRLIETLGIGTSAPTPSGQPEFTDGTNWYALATENYVINALSQIGIAPCIAASAGALTATYNNGTAGVGATLTSTTNQVFSLDGVSPPVGARVLIKDQADTTQNGIYSVTTVGSATAPGVPWVLTRTSDFDLVSQIFQGEIVFVITGTVNAVTAWMQTAVVTAIGTSSITFVALAKGSAETILPTAQETTVTVEGNTAIIGLADNTVIPGMGAITIPVGTTAQRPATPVMGMLRINTDA